MITWIIVILCIVYYMAGWILYIYYYRKLYKKDWEFTSILGSFFGLAFLWFIPFIIQELEKQRKEDPYTIHVIDTKVSNKDGIQILVDRSSYDNKSYVYYNFSTENYCGVIKINTKEMTLEELDTTVSKLKDWGRKQQLKNARIEAYKNEGID